MADHVLAVLSQDVFLLISSWLLEQGDHLEYNTLERRLLQKFVATPEEWANKLLALSRQPLGDQRPSVAFQEMKVLTKVPQEDGITQMLDLLWVLWLVRLLDIVRRGITNFLSTSEDELTKLADAFQWADRRASARTSMAATHVEALPPPEEPDDGNVAAAAPSQPRRWPQTIQRRRPPHQPPRGTPPEEGCTRLVPLPQ